MIEKSWLGRLIGFSQERDHIWEEILRLNYTHTRSHSLTHQFSDRSWEILIKILSIKKQNLKNQKKPVFF
jgi:hypothetical protein